MPASEPRHRPDGDRLVVVGASLAGLRAAEAARADGWAGSITLVGAEAHPPYDRPPLSKAGLEAGADPEPTWLHHGFEDAGFKTLLGAPATRFDPSTRTVVVGDEHVPYDALILATGSAPVLLPGTDGIAGVHTLRDHADSVTIRTALDEGAATVVIGAGFIGAEVASAARKRDLPVTIVEQLDTPLVRSLGPVPGRICAGLHQDAGVDLRLGTAVTGLRTDAGSVTGVALSDGSVVRADLVVVGIGARPATAWLAGSGIALHPDDGGVVCDATLATSLPGVWAAGDIARFPNALLDDEVMRLEHWTNATEQGAVAGRNAIRTSPPETLATIPYFWSDWYGHRLQFVGSPRADEVELLAADGTGALALYRRGDRLVGAFTLDRRRDVMKLRAQIAQRTDWPTARAFAEGLLARS